VSDFISLKNKNSQLKFDQFTKIIQKQLKSIIMNFDQKKVTFLITPILSYTIFNFKKVSKMDFLTTFLKTSLKYLRMKNSLNLV